jgi:hypothetical protein
MTSRAAVPHSFVRFTFVLLWSLVAWGALLIASAVVDSFSEGSTAFARLLPNREADAWGRLGTACVVLALGAGLLGVAFLASRRAARKDNA